MIVLFTLAISLNVFGHKVQKYSCRTLLFPTLIVLILNLICLYIGLQLNVTSKVFYLVFYGSVGVVSCLAWPICLYVQMTAYIDNVAILQRRPPDRNINVEFCVSIRRCNCLSINHNRGEWILS